MSKRDKLMKQLLEAKDGGLKEDTTTCTSTADDEAVNTSEWERTQLVTAIENIIMITKKLRIGLFLILAVSSYHNINVTVSSIYANKPHQL